MNSLDDLELELRKLPGVKAAGFDEREDVLLVQLHMGDRVDSAEHPVPIDASRIIARHVNERTVLEIVRWRTMPTASVPAPVIDVRTDDAAVTTEADAPAVAERAAAPEPQPAARRARLLAVLAFPDTNELEVHLILDGRRTIGRAISTDGLVGAVEATLAAVREIGAPFAPSPLWARAIDSEHDDRVLVAVASPIDAAARATLDALNRRLARAL
jgi:hypothetical protein